MDEGTREAMRRSAMCWVQPAGSTRAQPVWHLWHDDRMYVVTGEGEQDLPDCAEALVVVRDPDRPAERAGEWAASVSEVGRGTELWDTVLPLLEARRLNATGDLAGHRTARVRELRPQDR